MCFTSILMPPIKKTWIIIDQGYFLESISIHSCLYLIDLRKNTLISRHNFSDYKTGRNMVKKKM